MVDILFDMTAEKQQDLERLLDIVCGSHHTAVGYAIREAVAGERWHSSYLINPTQHSYMMGWGVPPKSERLVFFWTKREVSDFVGLPFQLDAKGIADFSMRWLKETDYGEEPDTDGHNQPGWRAYCESFGHVDSDWGAFLAVSPKWITYGK